MSLSLNKVHQFRQPPLQYASQNESQSFSAPGPSLQLLGGIFKDTRHVWHAKGASLEVRDTKTGLKVGAWVFGCILKDSNTKIVCVEEIQRPHGRLSMLAVGLECTISGGVICFFDVFSSKVVRAIQINEKISALHIIDPGIEDLNLPGPLRNFDGIMSIGTQGGNVYLVDICRQICEESSHSPIKRDELNPSQLVLLTSTKITRIEHYKEKCVRDNNHLAIHLNAILDSNTEHFTLKGPKGDDRIHVNREEVLTSGLYYCPQLTSLLVGYNFGAFQLWNLTTLQLVYTSPVCDEHLPVNRFALQEPTDDPRAFCYIWVSYSNTEQFQSGLPFVVMYSVCYESKEYQEGYGYLYQDFQYCAVRFQIELGPMDDQSRTGPPKGGHCLALRPVAKPARDARSISGDALVLCSITWSVWRAPADSHTCTALFDLDQWYKEQMPSFDTWQEGANYLWRARASDAPDVLDVAVDRRQLRQFAGVQRLEEHFRPSALSFDAMVLREGEAVRMRRRGEQHLLLAQIEATGPLCAVRPASVARRAVALGLLPLFSDCAGAGGAEGTQRELLLNLALEHRLLGWLGKCAGEWANGSFASAGCSLDFLLEWAYRRGAELKAHCDELCRPLFDYSQARLDGNAAALLTSCVRQIGDLCGLYAHATGKLPAGLGPSEVVEERHRSLQMVSVYFEVLQWLVNIGLLPECPPSAYPRRDHPEKISAPYPAQDLVQFYEEKRRRLDDDLLFIDHLVERKCGGSRLRHQWLADGGTGSYPPPSLQSLIRAYLVDGAGIAHKHSLVIYLFLDLAMALDQERYSSVITYLIKFPAVFKVSASSTKVTQAFWQLDHGDFSTALEHLLDPLVLAEDLQDWHHSLVIRALCAQKQFHYALLYLQTARPPMTSEPDRFAAISLFVANRMLDEAFYFVKRQQPCDRLLSHFFDECRRHEVLGDLLYRNFSETEERAFVGFLRDERNPTSEELQVFYYLLRSRFLEAFDAHEAGGRGRQGLVGQSKASRADQVVRIFRSLLPDVSKKLVEYVRKERGNLWREVRRPTPLSVFVHDNDEKIRYKSTLVHAALAKARQTDRNDSREVATENTPFLRTPKTNKSASKFVTPVITPQVVELTDDSPSPAKRAKLSPMLLTPIVRRKLSGQKIDSPNSRTPHGILRSDLSAVLARTPRQHVQFDMSGRVSSSFSEPPTALEDRILRGSSKDDSEETFFSPDNSLVEEEPERMEQPVGESEAAPQPEAEEGAAQSPRARRSYKRCHKEMSPVRSSPRLAKLVDSEPDQVSSNKSTEPSTSDESPSQSPRMLQKVKGRKSLSRKVLEHNAFSKMQTPAAVNTVISITKTEKTTVVETSPSASKLTVVEARLDVSDVSNADPQSPAGRSALSVTSNVSRRSILESDISFDSDTSIGSDIFLQVQPKIRVPEIPEWLNEYAAKLQARKDAEFNSPEEEEPPVEEVPAPPAEEVTEPPVEEIMEPAIDEIAVLPVEKEPATLEVVVEENGGKVFEGAERSVDEEKSNEVISMEIYEDLSCGSEASSEDKNDDFNELELNVFEVTKNAAGEFSSSDERYVQLSGQKDSPEKEAIVILSSGEESGQSNESVYQEDMNLSFERNIQVEDYSTDDSSGDEAHARSDDGIAGNDSSTEKWGFHDREDRRQVVLATDQRSEAGDDARVVIDQGEAADGGQENGDSSSSSTEKWNYSDREDIDDHVEAESLRNEGSEEQPDSSIGGMKAALVASPDEFEANEVHSTDALAETLGNGGAIEKDNSTIPVDGELQHIEDAFVAAGAQTTEAGVAIGEDKQVDDEELHNMEYQALAASEYRTSKVGDELQNMEEEELAASEDQTPDIGEAIEADQIQSPGEELQNMEEEAAVASRDHTQRVGGGEQFQLGTEHDSGKTNEEVADNEANGEIQKTDAAVACQDHPNGMDATDESNEKKDQPIETTTAAKDFERNTKRNKKKDQSTNTTIKETVKAKSKSSKDSSSDTTEGDPASQEIVVTALVHTPSRTETDEPLVKRVTRRSLLLSQKSEGDKTPSIFEDTRIESNMDVTSSDDVFAAANPLTPVRRRARRSSQNSDIIDCQSSTSKETVAEPKVAALLRKTRSASVDDVKTYSRKRSLQRSNSVDEAPVTEKPTKSKGKAKSVVLMPAITEEQSAKAYATSRRLTRSQANMVKEMKSGVDVDECHDSDKTIQLDYIDPIGLLDKESYQGDRDPEEKKIYEGSSPSESIASSFSRPTRRKSRSVSVASDISLPLSPTKSVTPEKKPTRKYGSGVKTRLRKVSETSSVVSEKSETATPTKKTRKKAEVSDGEASKPSRTTRSRVNSVSSAKSDPANSPRKSSRSRRATTAKIDLPEITEEKINEVTVASTMKRQTRKRTSP